MLQKFKNKPVLLQIVGSTKKLGRGNDIDLRGFFNEGIRFERHDKITHNDTVIDVDLWNKDYAIKQIKKGLNSCPLLYSCLFGNQYEHLEKEGEDLIKNRDSLRSEKLITGTLRFCDRKIKQSKGNRLKHPKGKYIYYAISDLYESIEIIETKDCIYPLRFSQIERQLIEDLRNDKNIEKGYNWYSELSNNICQLEHKL